MKRLTKKTDSFLCEQGIRYLREPVNGDFFEVLNKLGELEDAIENGYMFIAPCKEGDRLYWINNEDAEGNEKYTIEKTEPLVAVMKRNGEIYVQYEENEFDKLGERYALLTYEDAEKMVKELESMKKWIRNREASETE